MQYCVHGFARGNEFLRPDKAFGWSDNVEIAASWRGPTRQAPSNHLRHSHQSNGRLRHYFAIQYGDYYIRGVTAGLLVNLHRHVAGD